MGDFLLCKFNRIGERGCRGGEEEAVGKCKGEKVERWEGRIRGRGLFYLQFLKFL